MNVHMNAAVPEIAGGEIDIQTMKNYVAFCKSYVVSLMAPASGGEHCTGG